MSSASGGLRPPDPLQVSLLPPQHPYLQKLPTPLHKSKATPFCTDVNTDVITL